MLFKSRFCTSVYGISKILATALIIFIIITAGAVAYYFANQQIPNNSHPAAPSAETTNPPASTNPPITSNPTEESRATLTLEIIDSETQKIVNDVSVLSDGKEAYAKMQNGGLILENLAVGVHRISIFAPYYDQPLFEQDITVSENATIPISVDMPNPVFQADVDVSLDYVAFHELGRVSITLNNTGQVESQNTKAIVFVYLENNLESPVTTKIINFGTIATGEQAKKEIAGLDSFVYSLRERVAVAILEQSEYIPRNDKVITDVLVPSWFVETVQKQIDNFISEHAEIDGVLSNSIIIW